MSDSHKVLSVVLFLMCLAACGLTSHFGTEGHSDGTDFAFAGFIATTFSGLACLGSILAADGPSSEAVASVKAERDDLNSQLDKIRAVLDGDD